METTGELGYHLSIDHMHDIVQQRVLLVAAGLGVANLQQTLKAEGVCVAAWPAIHVVT